MSSSNNSNTLHSSNTSARLTTDQLKQHRVCLDIYKQFADVKRVGEDKLFGKCPLHGDMKSDSFSVYRDSTDGTWMWKCHGKCNESGNIFQFLMHPDLHLNEVESFHDAKEYVRDAMQGLKDDDYDNVVLFAPKPKVVWPVTDILKFEESLVMPEHDDYGRAYLEKRGITLSTAQKLRIGFRTTHPSTGQRPAHGFLVFPSIYGKEVRSIKYRPLDDSPGKSRFIREVDMASEVWFNHAAIGGAREDDLWGEDDLYIVEGEIDCATMEQAGFHCVSLPSGTTYSPEMGAEIAAVTSVILAGDNDDVGKQAMRKVAVDVPHARALQWPAGHKDANDVFVKLCDKDVSKFRKLVLGLTASAKVILPNDDSTSTENELDAEALEMPEAALYGKLGQMAQDMKMSLGLAYPALLTAYSVVPHQDEIAGTRINLFTALLARIGGGKNVAIRRTIDTLQVDAKRSSPASDRGLLKLMKSKHKLLIASNEMNDVFMKLNIEKSTLGSRLCDFWDENECSVPDRKGDEEVDCRLSWLGGVPVSAENPDEFSETFGRETMKGLYSRMLFGYSGKKFNYRPWESGWTPETESESSARLQLEKTLKFSATAEAIADQWGSETEIEDPSGRLKFNLHKIAVLTALANGDAEVTEAGMKAAIAFMDWQRRLREVFRAGGAGRSEAAKCTEAVLMAVRRRGGKTKPVNLTRLKNDLDWEIRFGAPLLNQVISNLKLSGTLAPEDGRKGTNWVTLKDE